MLRYDDEQVEWYGIPPDIRVENKPDELKNNIDRQLEFAIDYLK